MHHAHVNCKERTMKQMTLESYLKNPRLSADLYASARRARAQAVHELVAGLIHRLTPRLDAGVWIGRLG
jgi:hypothetical protein